MVCQNGGKFERFKKFYKNNVAFRSQYFFAKVFVKKFCKIFRYGHFISNLAKHFLILPSQCGIVAALR